MSTFLFVFYYLTFIITRIHEKNTLLLVILKIFLFFQVMKKFPVFIERETRYTFMQKEKRFPFFKIYDSGEPQLTTESSSVNIVNIVSFISLKV